MGMLTAAAAVFLLMHLLIAGTPARDKITGVIGEGPYMGLFALASIACLAWLVVAFTHAHGSAADTVFWSATPGMRHAAIGLVLIAFLFMIPGLLTNGPTRVAGGGLADKPAAVHGMTRITRHPFLWGVVIWAFAHLLVNGTRSALLLFGSLLLLSLLGTFSIDAKRMRALGGRYAGFKAQTSNIPFAAIAQGRQGLKLGEIWWRLLIGMVLFCVVLMLHPMMFGVNPLGPPHP